MITIKSIKAKIAEQKRISTDDALFLFTKGELLEIGEIAAAINERKNGRRVYFNINRHINPTNICVNRCKFCAFSKNSDENGAYTLSIEDVKKKVREASNAGATEIHVVGGLHPDLKFDYYINLLRSIKESAPSIHIKGFTAVEIDYLSKIAGLSIEDTFKELIAAGLGSMPGGGAEILVQETREKICPEKIAGAKWLEIMEKAHNCGLKSNATMLYGHLESYEDRVEHLSMLRNLQDKTGGFQAFIPLPFQPENSDIKINSSLFSGVDDLKTLAISRIFLDNFDHIKAYWVMLGEKVAQVSLSFGVNDLDGTVVEEKIGHDAGAKSPQSLSIDRLLYLIKTAGKIPVERDTLYNELRRFE